MSFRLTWATLKCQRPKLLVSRKTKHTEEEEEDGGKHLTVGQQATETRAHKEGVPKPERNLACWSQNGAVPGWGQLPLSSDSPF